MTDSQQPLLTRTDVRIRLLMWFTDDEQRLPVSVAAALYVDDDKVTETTWVPGPFDDLTDLIDELLTTVYPEQLRLF
jgi:hypothetical protein